MRHETLSDDRAPTPTGAPPPEAGIAPGSGWSPRLVVSTVALAIVLETVSISTYMVATAMPSIAAEFSTTQVAWVMTAWLLAGAIASPLLGRIADIHGKRRTFVIALVIATAGCVLSAAAPSFGLLLVGRALFGALVPCMFLAFSLMRDVFPARTLGLAVSLAAAGMGVMAIPAPFVAGWLLDTWSYRSVFWFFAIVLAVALPLIVASTPESSVRARARIDLVGAVLLGTGLAGVLVAISLGPTDGWTSPTVLFWGVFGPIVLAVWAVTGLRFAEPLIDLRYFRSGPLGRICIVAGIGYGVMTVFTTVLPMMAMTPTELSLGYGFGVTAHEFAVLQVPIGIGSILGGIIVGRLLRRSHPSLTLPIGVTVMGLACLGSALVHDAQGPVAAWVGLFGLGMGMFTASVPTLVIASVPATVQASMASMVATAQSLVSSAFPVVVFAMLNSRIATVVSGSTFYTDGGITLAFVVSAAAALVAVAVAVTLVRRRAFTAAPSPDPAAPGTDTKIAEPVT